MMMNFEVTQKVYIGPLHATYENLQEHGAWYNYFVPISIWSITNQIEAEVKKEFEC